MLLAKFWAIFCLVIYGLVIGVHVVSCARNEKPIWTKEFKKLNKELLIGLTAVLSFFSAWGLVIDHFEGKRYDEQVERSAVAPVFNQLINEALLDRTERLVADQLVYPEHSLIVYEPCQVCVYGKPPTPVVDWADKFAGWYQYACPIAWRARTKQEAKLVVLLSDEGTDEIGHYSTGVTALSTRWVLRFVDLASQTTVAKAEIIKSDPSTVDAFSIFDSNHRSRPGKSEVQNIIEQRVRFASAR